MTKCAYLLSLALLACGCSVAELAESTAEPTKNQCSAGDDCGDGECQFGTCRAKQGEFGVVLFEVTPPSDAPQALADVHFLKPMNLDVRGGTQDLVLDHVARVTGTILVNSAADQTCVHGRTALRVTFKPTERLGLPTTAYSAKTRPSAVATESEQTFELNLPAGGYDVYVEDAEHVEGAAPAISCPRAPKLFRGIDIQAGIVRLPLQLGPPAQLDLTVTFPVNSNRTLDGWSIDIVHPDTSDETIISTEAELRDPERSIIDWRYSAKLYYSAMTNGAMGRELVRLQPPDGADAPPAPTIELQRDGLELWTKGQATINHLRSLPEAVDFSGTVFQKENLNGVPASVSLIGNKFDPPLPGTFASFRQTVDAGADGKFTAKLLPGLYRVHAVPAPGSGFAATETTLEVGRSPARQEGKVIEVSQAGVIDGSLVGPKGFISGASVHAVAAPASIKVSAFGAADGTEPFVPRASGCSGKTASCVPLTDESGRFSIEADPGVFDVSIRPQADSGFAWLVRPNVVVADFGQPQPSQLGQLELPLPVVYTGNVTDVDGRVVPGALIKAYIYTDGEAYTADPKNASVLQVAETRANDDGSFELLLPARLMKQF